MFVYAATYEGAGRTAGSLGTCIPALRKCQIPFCAPQPSWGSLSSAAWKPAVGRSVLWVPWCGSGLPQPHGQQLGYRTSRLWASPKLLLPWHKFGCACRCQKPTCALHVLQNNTIWKCFSWVSQCRYHAKGKGGRTQVPTERQVFFAHFTRNLFPLGSLQTLSSKQNPTFHFPSSFFIYQGL